MIGQSKQIYITICFVLAMVASPLMAQNNPYVDDKLLHFGFSLGVDFLSYGVEEADSLLQMQRHGTIYHARTTAPGVGFSVGFIADLRLARHLNLRFCPGMHFGERTITYKNYSISDYDIKGTNCTDNRPSVLCLPIDIPLYLKWSAEREVNYRPYVTLGGGVSFDLGRAKDKVLLQKTTDCFMEVGLGCDLYCRWFKLAPEIRYRIGFNNMLTPTADCEKEEWKLPLGDYFYTDALSKLTNQQVSLIFNFE
jgi:hypothetical protein